VGRDQVVLAGAVHAGRQRGDVPRTDVGQQRALEHALRTQGDDQCRQPEPGDQPAVDQAEHRTDPQRKQGEDDQRGGRSTGSGELHGGVRGEDGDCREGDVDPAGDDDDQDGQGEDHRHDRAANHREEGSHGEE